MRTALSPLNHQNDAYNRFINQPYGALFCEMGTGKTKIMLDIIQNSPERGTLVAAPNGLHLNWFHEEIPKHLHEDFNYSMYCWKGTPTSRRAKTAWTQFLAEESEHKFFLINVEAIRNKNGADHAQAFLKALGSSHFIIDESTCIKNPKAAQTKSAIKLGLLATRRWILNGTPITQGPLDLYSQSKFLAKDSIPYNNYTAFKGTFAIEQVITMQNRSFRKIIGHQQLDRLADEVSPFSLRLLKSECLDLPEKVFVKYVVEMTKEQQQAHQQLKDLCMTQLASGEIVSVQLALTKLMKLHHILTGFIKDDDGVVHPLPNNRVNAVLQIAESSQPLVIFCAYRENVRMVSEALRTQYGADSVVEYTGGTTGPDRTRAVERFQSGEAQFFIGTSAAAKGLTLHKASHMVYFSNNFSLETRLQSQDRIHRIGQSKKCTYTDIVIPGSADMHILERLLQKKELSDTVLDDIKALLT